MKKSIKDSRLRIFQDIISEESFIIKTSEIVFARLNKIGSKWVVWFYHKKIQKEFPKIREALNCINEQFREFWIYK